MKNSVISNDKKIIGKLILFVILFFIFIFCLIETPGFNKLLGSVFSSNILNNEKINTGVIIDINKSYSLSNPLSIKIYNGSNKKIEVTNQLIKNGYCKESDEPCNFIMDEIKDLEIGSDFENTYNFSNTNLYDEIINRVGIRYQIENNNMYLKIAE